MRPVRLHPLVYDDIDEALAQTRERFGPAQVRLYEQLIVEGRPTLRLHPTIGQHLTHTPAHALLAVEQVPTESRSVILVG